MPKYAFFFIPKINSLPKEFQVDLIHAHETLFYGPAYNSLHDCLIFYLEQINCCML